MATGRITGQDAGLDIAGDLGAKGAARQAERWLRLGREAGLGRVETPDGLEVRFRGDRISGPSNQD